MWREVTKLKNDPSVPIAMLTLNFFEALIVASIFYNLRETTDSFFMRGGVLFMMVSDWRSYHQRLQREWQAFVQYADLSVQVLLNAFGSMLEIMSLYAKRTIVEKVRQGPGI